MIHGRHRPHQRKHNKPSWQPAWARGNWLALTIHLRSTYTPDVCPHSRLYKGGFHSVVGRFYLTTKVFSWHWLVGFVQALTTESCHSDILLVIGVWLVVDPEGSYASYWQSSTIHCAHWFFNCVCLILKEEHCAGWCCISLYSVSLGWSWLPGGDWVGFSVRWLFVVGLSVSSILWVSLTSIVWQSVVYRELAGAQLFWCLGSV